MLIIIYSYNLIYINHIKYLSSNGISIRDFLENIKTYAEIIGIKNTSDIEIITTGNTVLNYLKSMVLIDLVLVWSLLIKTFLIFLYLSCSDKLLCLLLLTILISLKNIV